MGRPRIRLRSLCLGRAKSCVRVFSASSFRSRPSSASIKYGNITDFSSSISQEYSSGSVAKADKGAESGNKIMVVVDSSLEAIGALDWALSHAVQTRDTVLLVHVAKPTRQGAESSGKLNPKVYQLLLDMKNMCQNRRPGVEVELVMLEGEEKGCAIVEEAKQKRVTLLVIGQRKRSILWCLVRRWGRKRSSTGVADYCIQNASCMTIAVRRKNKKLGGYLITTKRHKNFWLLA